MRTRRLRWFSRLSLAVSCSPSRLGSARRSALVRRSALRRPRSPLPALRSARRSHVALRAARDVRVAASQALPAVAATLP